MIGEDAFGNPVEVDEPASLAALVDFTEGFVACEARAANVLAAGARDEAPIVQAYCAALHLFAESPAGPVGAAPYLARAVQGRAKADARTALLIDAIEAWSRADVARTLALHDTLAERHPRDLAAIKLGQYHRFNLGDAPGMLRLGLTGLRACADLPWAWGMAAFGLEQCDQLREAESHARRAIALREREPWAQHAMAHVLLTEGRIDEGVDFLAGHSDGWTGLNSFMVTHNWWHLALFLLERDDLAGALELHDRRVWGVVPEYSQDQINAVSLLARIELAGGEVGDRWQPLAEHLSARVHDHVQPFLDLQYLYGLARAQRPQADALLASMRTHAQSQQGPQAAAWQRVAVPAAQGLLAHARGRMDEAAEQLGQALPRLAEIGGSHAQRDLFERIWIDAVAGAGRLSAAHHLLATRARSAPESRLAARQAGELARRLGIASGA